MVDRTGQTSKQAVGIVSIILKTQNDTDLSEFTLSRSTVERKGNFNWLVMMQQNMEEFNLKKPVGSALHQNGKLINYVIGKNQEKEAILLFRASHYLEGEFPSVSRLTSEDGDHISFVVAHAEALVGQIKEQDVVENIVAFVFNTTASNTRRQSAEIKKEQEK